LPHVRSRLSTGQVLGCLDALHELHAQQKSHLKSFVVELLKELSQAVSEKAKLKQAIDLNRTDNKGNTG